MDPIHALYRHIAERREMLTLHLTAGRAQNFEDYRRVTGALQELEIMESALKDIERRYAEE